MNQPALPPALADALGHAASDRRLEVLRRLAACGSISQAARDGGISYKAAWQAIDTLGNLAGTPVVTTAVGGSGGGGARLTPAGERLLAAADALARARGDVLARLGAGAAMATTGLRTSLRNQLPATVVAWRRTSGFVTVTLALGGGQALTARITRESTELLGLAPGRSVLALFKATAVRIEPATAGTGSLASGPDANRLSGTVVRASRAAGGGECSLALPGGLRVVGFAPAGHGLRAGAAARAVVDEAAVVVGLAD